jgi:hypothetical protein
VHKYLLKQKNRAAVEGTRQPQDRFQVSGVIGENKKAGLASLFLADFEWFFFSFRQIGL